MAIAIQNIFKCKHYAPDDNLNLTCIKEPLLPHRCWIYDEVTCPNYEEVDELKK